MWKFENSTNLFDILGLSSPLNATSGKIFFGRSCDLISIFSGRQKYWRKIKVWICLFWWKIWILQKILGNLHKKLVKIRPAVIEWRPCKVSDYTRFDLVSVTFDLKLYFLVSRLLINIFQCLNSRFQLEFYVDFKYLNHF